MEILNCIDPIVITYIFSFDRVNKHIYELRLDPVSLTAVNKKILKLPEWAKLEFSKCPNCPLKSTEHEDCYLALNLIQLMQDSGKMISYQRLHVEIITAERNIYLETTAQRAISSLMGLLIATSGCPHTDFLKPMARFHVPFASEEETIYRAVSMYLLAQYFIHNKGDQIDFKLTGLVEKYQQLQIVNSHVSNRLRSASDQDASVNALILLDFLGKNLPFAIEDSLEELKYMFKHYFF